ncbi:hypothetical protein GJ496_004261 [Pomphorhynchus laevis]|nr:hypothetical protein GJ496_004261 [Pomphorhynchus laevis]
MHPVENPCSIFIQSSDTYATVVSLERGMFGADMAFRSHPTKTISSFLTDWVTSLSLCLNLTFSSSEQPCWGAYAEIITILRVLISSAADIMWFQIRCIAVIYCCRFSDNMIPTPFAH